jgi:hypothetical protein
MLGDWDYSIQKLLDYGENLYTNANDKTMYFN